MAGTKISPERYVEIHDWLRDNCDRIRRTECTQLEAAAMAKQALGYRVPHSTLIRMAKKAGVTWANSPPKPSPVPLEREAIIILMGAIEGLYIETTGSAPANLTELKRRYVQDGKLQDKPKTPVYAKDT